MRWKIIAANSVIVILTGLISFVLLRDSLVHVLANRSERRAEAERAVGSAVTRLELDSLRLERWLSSAAAEPSVRAVFESGTHQARADNATVEANRLHEALAKNRSLSASGISLVLLVDSRGVSLGRNNSNQMRGEDIAHSYPSLREALRRGGTTSRLWLNPQRQEQLLVSYAPVRGEGGEVVGVLVAGSPLNDERLSRLSRQTSGRSLTVAASKKDGSVEVVAEGTHAGDRDAFAAMRRPSVLNDARESLASGHIVFHDSDKVFAAEPIRGYASSGVFLVVGMDRSLVPSVSGLLWPLAGVCALGIALVVAVGSFLGNYISQPISELEEGLLSIINGRTNHRFELEHPELGGLVSRINSLLNALMGVPETDESGRTSSPPGAQYREAEGP